MPLRGMRNSGWMHMSLYQCRSGVQHTGQGQWQQQSGVKHGHAGHEITGSARLAFGKWPQRGYASVTRSLLQFSHCPGNPSPTSEEVSCQERIIPNILLQSWNTMGKSKCGASEGSQGSHKKGMMVDSPWVLTVAIVRWPQRFGLVTHCFL